MKLKNTTLNHYTNLLKAKGRDGVYSELIGDGLLKGITPGANPDLDMLLVSESFFALYRGSGEEGYFELGKVFRRAAHTVYRRLLKLNENKKTSEKFLHMVG
jgi:hypothetical protein